MSTVKFENWFQASFGVKVPRGYLEFIAKNPNSVYNGRGGSLWDVQYAMSETDVREMAEKGVCVIGGGDSLTHYLLRAKDGRVFVVDRLDYSVVDAWFSSIDDMLALMGFDPKNRSYPAP